MKLSIITVNYNNRDGLHRTIESVICQTCEDYEYIIIDGGSTDGSVDVIREYANHIDYWVSEKDGGIYPAMNKGVRQAHGDYCIFMNSGDAFYDGNVLKDVSISNLHEDIIIGKVVSDSGKELFAPPSEKLTMYFFYSSTLAHQGSFIRTKLLMNHPYDEQLKIVADWKFFVDRIVFDDCSVGFVDNVVTVFDTTGVSTSNSSKTWNEKLSVMQTLFPPRVLADYAKMKESECLTQQLTPQLRKHYRIDRMIYHMVKFILKL